LCLGVDKNTIYANIMTVRNKPYSNIGNYMLDKLKEIAKDFGYGLLVTAGIVGVMYGVILLLELLTFTKEQGSNIILGICMLFLVYTFGGLLRFNRQK
jgi:hypothetical protein